MKKTLLALTSVLFCAITFAQSVPQGINYQAVARDANGDVLMNQALTIRFSIISDINTSAISWQEKHVTPTNEYGLYTTIIGQGSATSAGSSSSFDVIDWGASNHLLKVEVDYGSGYIDMGTTAFMSVPYAFQSVNPGPQGPVGNDGSQGPVGATGPQGPSGGSKKYLVRLEYDVNETLVANNTTFVTATGFATSGASVVSQTANAGSNSGHNITLNFSDTNPPTSIIGYGWNPATGNYTAAAYDRDTKQVQYEVGIGAFTNQSTTDGGSGDNGQWAGASFSGAGSYNIKLDVDQSALSYGNAVAGAFGSPSKLPHAYLIISF